MGLEMHDEQWKAVPGGMTRLSCQRLTRPGRATTRKLK